jgi:hypothetical protein
MEKAWRFKMANLNQTTKSPLLVELFYEVLVDRGKAGLSLGHFRQPLPLIVL